LTEIRDGMMDPVVRFRRPLAFGLAAVVLLAASLTTEGASLDERVSACAGCHGEDGNSRTENVPSLAGQPQFFLLMQLVLMREGVRRADGMAALINDLKDDELEKLASHFASLPSRSSGETIDPVLVKRGEQLALSRLCRSCHMPTMSGHQQIPRLAKQRIDYLVTTLKSYRDSLRPGADTAMSANIAGASDDDIVALAHYVASL
jgi:cytochrome c553